MVAICQNFRSNTTLQPKQGKHLCTRIPQQLLHVNVLCPNMIKFYVSYALDFEWSTRGLHMVGFWMVSEIQKFNQLKSRQMSTTATAKSQPFENQSISWYPTFKNSGFAWPELISPLYKIIGSCPDGGSILRPPFELWSAIKTVD